MSSILPLLIRFLRDNELYKTEQALYEELAEIQQFQLQQQELEENYSLPTCDQDRRDEIAQEEFHGNTDDIDGNFELQQENEVNLFHQTVNTEPEDGLDEPVFREEIQEETSSQLQSTPNDSQEELDRSLSYQELDDLTEDEFKSEPQSVPTSPLNTAASGNPNQAVRDVMNDMMKQVVDHEEYQTYDSDEEKNHIINDLVDSEEYEGEDDYDSSEEGSEYDFRNMKFEKERRSLSAPLEQVRLDDYKVRELELDLKSLARELKLEKEKGHLKHDPLIDEYDNEDDRGYVRVSVKRDHYLYSLIDEIEEYPDQQLDEESGEDFSDTEEMDFSDYFDSDMENDGEKGQESDSEENNCVDLDQILEDVSTKFGSEEDQVIESVEEQELDQETSDEVTLNKEASPEGEKIHFEEKPLENDGVESDRLNKDEENENGDWESQQPIPRRRLPLVYDTMYLPVIHERNKTGFEESKDFPIAIDSIIAGRYLIQEYLGSAAFSRAVQCVDLTNNQLVCIKIIKNSKDFFDQSLDEIKLLRYINASGDADEYNVIQLYDFFYHKEHLFLVCELLRDNLYEFSKYNRENEDELYFTIPRLQRITTQVLDGLSFIHSLGLIHCDLKPENILIRSYSRCLVKIIDFGSSCFLTDHLCSYVQSRTYRAPEVVLGLKYDQKVDVWSLGCILAELWTGRVLFVNKSIQTMLARVIGLCGEFPRDMIEKGQFTPKFFTKDGKIFEKNRKTGHISFIVPKKTTLEGRLKCDDALFIDFIRQCLQIDPRKRPTINELLQHPWILSKEYPPVVPQEMLV